MRARLTVVLLLLAAPALAGCAENPATTSLPATTPSPTPSAATPPRPVVIIEPVCEPFIILHDKPDGFVPGEEMRFNATLRNCTSETLTATIPYCPKPGELEMRLTVDGEDLFLRYGSARPEPADEGCDTFARVLEPNATFVLDGGWDGRVATTACTGFCSGEWAEPGAYALHVTLVSREGARWEADATLTLLAPRLPPYVNDGKITLLMNESYRAGESATILARNDDTVAYSYRTFYAACDLAYFGERGYPFLIPPGTHCDIANSASLAPGETVTLFSWPLTECTEDNWGCSESRPLPPGTYHVAGTFHQDVDRYWEKPDATTRAGVTFRIEG